MNSSKKIKDLQNRVVLLETLVGALVRVLVAENQPAALSTLKSAFLEGLTIKGFTNVEM